MNSNEIRILAVSIFFTSVASGEKTTHESMTHIPSMAEASSIIAVEMAQRHQAVMARRDSIIAEEAQDVWSYGVPNRGVILRRVAPRPWTQRKLSPAQVDGADLPLLENNALESRNIHFSITVFDHQASELIWWDGQESHTAISNIDFNHFAPLGGFDQDGVSWQFLCFVENIDSEKSFEFERLAREAGYDVSAPSAPDISMLDTDKPNYAVYADDAELVPGAMIEALDALHRHYAIHGPRLEAQWKRTQILNEARRAWHEANPPIPRATITNFWPVRSKRHAAQP